ncbi:MAG: murein transglycosylase A [Nitrosomonas sp.]|jgi:membrane-bound lytic murein transglycosylase A|uniref:murein transglycosylase A n=1 Tax=Nitrosomonas sp. TaxID=42353 RepID=UPI0027369C49|nr:murein transglycosylase A [Nitrosomonas sp.]MDP1935063.1 murein transglycosylase A [Nitrosomonas sp.]MDP3282187.1 murein transglycosylase A [Nitrosomonas sp.]MDP3661876.1 murein transglycosylase A [Nitrosomonas sp.]MDZ4105249.1 murein transglycosylase A [Nitrosomonas sp.]
MKNQLSFIVAASFLLLAACTTGTISPTLPPSQPAETVTPPPEKPLTKSIHKRVQWSALTGWTDDDLLPAWQAFLKSCTVLSKQPVWKENCKAATSLQKPNNTTLRNFFESYFTPYQIINTDNSEEGLVTGYYEPLLKGSRKPSSRYRYPIYATPSELLTIDLGAAYPELKDLRLRGRLDGRKIVPYYSRAEIMTNPKILNGYEILWVEDEVELFFLHIQGSGRVVFDNGQMIKIGFSDQNGHPYNSIGKLLVQRGELPLEKASMQGIKQWGQQNPSKLPALLQQNARYVFFRELPADLSGPIGALGVPLTAGRSIAIDPLSIPQGAPVFLATTWPNTNKPLNRLMVAQDVGSAIKGGIRADFFWGFGHEAGNQAGRMKQSGKMWVLMPRSYTAPVLTRQ